MKILLLNGWSVPNTMWSGFFDELCNVLLEKGVVVTAYEMIAIDRPLTKKEWFQEIDPRVDEDTMLVGWSLGGMLATAYAASSERNFVGLVTLMSNLCFIRTQDCSWAMSRDDFETFRKDLSAEADKTGFFNRFSSLVARGDTQLKAAIRFLRERYRVDGCFDDVVLTQSLELLGGLDVTSEIAEVKVPLLMLFGEADALSGCPSNEQAQKLRELNGDASVQRIPTGHLPFMGARQTVQEHMIDFAVANA